MAGVTAKEVIKKMKSDGWSLSEEGVECVLEGNSFNLHQATQKILDSDLKDVGSPCLTEDVLKGKKPIFQGPVVLQVTKMRNVSAPKAFEESGGAPRMLKISLTDGISTLHGLELQNIKALSLRTAPGTKIRLSGKIPINGGFLMLNQNNITVLGGTVQELYEKWKLSVSVSKFSRLVRAADGSGPPPWVAFGKRIEKDHRELQQFKSLKDPVNDRDKHDDEFESNRKQAVKELAKEGNVKVFGGGKQLLDATVQKVVNAGFKPSEAEWALRNNHNDPARAIKELRGNFQSGSNQPPMPSERGFRQQEENDMTSGRGRGGRGAGRGRGSRGRGGRGGGGPDDSDDDYEQAPNMPRPSGPASLFDFLDNKMIQKKEKVNFVEPVADVRGPSYQDGRRGGGGRRGRGQSRGSSYGRGAINGSLSPPNLTTENWPAPGEDTAPTSNRTYFESKELMEEREYQANTGAQGLYTQYGGARGQSNVGRGQGYGGWEEDRGQGYGDRNQRYGRENGNNRNQNYRDSRGGGRGQSYGRNDHYQQDNRRGNRGASGGGYRGGYSESGTGNYYHQSEGGGRGGRGAGYRSGNTGNYNTGGNSGSSNNYDYNNRQVNPSPRGRGGGNWNARGGGGVKSTSEYTSKEMEMIKAFQQSMTMEGHYDHPPPRLTNQRGRYDGSADYTNNFVGTLEFTRGGRGGNNGPRRGGRGYGSGYY